jgi:hypothetical protein
MQSKRRSGYGVTAEHVEIGPAAGDGLGGPLIQEFPGGVDDPPPALRQEPPPEGHRGQRRSLPPMRAEHSTVPISARACDIVGILSRVSRLHGGPRTRSPRLVLPRLGEQLGCRSRSASTMIATIDLH